MDYEYQFVIKAGELLDNITSLEPRRVIAGLSVDLEAVAESLTNPPEGSWEVVSHSIFPIGQTLVTTVLVRRPKI